MEKRDKKERKEESKREKKEKKENEKREKTEKRKGGRKEAREEGEEREVTSFLSSSSSLLFPQPLPPPTTLYHQTCVKSCVNRAFSSPSICRPSSLPPLLRPHGSSVIGTADSQQGEASVAILWVIRFITTLQRLAGSTKEEYCYSG